MRFRLSAIGAGGLVLCLAAAAAPGATAGIYQLQGALSTSANVVGVSADGSTAVGYVSRSSGPVAMKWSATGTVTNLGFGDWTRATAVSNGGSTLAGWQGSTARDGYRWTAGNGKTSLGGMGVPLASRYDQPTDITPDGSVIVGSGGNQATSSTRAFRWTAATGMVSLGTLDSSNQPATKASGVSADGNVVVGEADGSSNWIQPFRWTPAGGMQPLTGVPAAGGGTARGVSGDGSVIVGQVKADNFAPWQAFRWTESDGMQLLPGFSPGGDSNVANAASFDGSVIVGMTTAPGNTIYATVWIDGQHLLLSNILNGLGVNTSAWTLDEALDVSADGRTIVGTGSFNGGSTSFIAVIPEPASAATLLLPAIFMFTQRRRPLFPRRHA